MSSKTKIYDCSSRGVATFARVFEFKQILFRKNKRAIGGKHYAHAQLEKRLQVRSDKRDFFKSHNTSLISGTEISHGLYLQAVRCLHVNKVLLFAHKSFKNDSLHLISEDNTSLHIF